MTWRAMVDVFSMLGGIFALMAMWLYFRPRAIITIETYEYVPGTGQRRFRLLVRNPGNVHVTILRLTQLFQGDIAPDAWADPSRMFQERVLPPSAEIPVWLDEKDMARRVGFAITYRGWTRHNYPSEVRFDIRDFGADHYLVARDAGTASEMATVVKQGERLDR